MSNRPSIPAEIAREILIESGHRCAVCGAGCPLERAHIIPWHKSREHKAEDLICLCANCHQRAHHEGWREKTLREYKRRPWVMRYEETDNIPEPKTEIHIEIDMELDRFDERFQRLLKSGLAGFLEISPNSVRITSMGEGSVKVTIELPTQSAERLLSAYKRNDSELVKYLAPLVLLDLQREEAKHERIRVHIMSGEMPEPSYSLSSLADELKRLQPLRDQYSENLYRLKLRAAKHGVIDVPLPLEYEIAETESQLKELDREIAQLRHKFEIKIEGEEEEKQTRRQERDLFRNFWKIGEEEELFCAISTVRHEYTGKYRRRATGLGEIRGYASIVSSLSRAYERDVMTDARLFFGDTFPQDDERLASSWILLGGDDKNHVTRLMMKQFEDQDKKLPFRFHYEKNWRGKETGVKCLFVQELEGKEEIPFIPQYAKAERVNRGSALVIGEVWAKALSLLGKAYGQVVRDYGVVARLPNPLHPQSRLYIMAGCHTYGTAAAAKAVATKAILRRVEKTCPYYLTKKFFLAVVRCHMTSENLVHIHRMEAFYPLDEKTLRPIPEGVVRGVDLVVRGDM